MNQPWHDERQAARILGITDRTLRAYRKKGLIGYCQLPGGRIRYTLDQLTDFERSCRVAASVKAAE